MSVRAIADTIRGYDFSYASEDDLQRGIAEALTTAGHHVEREARLGVSCRIDLLVGRVGIEAKTAGASSVVASQVERYLATGALDGIVLVSSRATHLRVASLVNDDRLVVVSLPMLGRGL